jgi:hypothetical protein
MKNEAKTKSKTSKSKLGFGFGVACDLGYMIALPIVLFTFLGAYMDKKFATSPFFILLAVVFSIAISTITIIRKFNSYIK